MGLKVTQPFTITNRFGGKEGMFLTWKKIIEADIATGGAVAFAVYENETEWQRGNMKSVLPMHVTQSDILDLFSLSGNVALVISTYSWEKAQTIKFIPDYQWDDQQNNYVEVLKSLSDLNVELTDIGNPFE